MGSPKSATGMPLTRHHDNRPRAFVAVHDRAQRRELELAGYWIESGSPQGYWMRVVKLWRGNG